MHLEFELTKQDNVEALVCDLKEKKFRGFGLSLFLLFLLLGSPILSALMYGMNWDISTFLLLWCLSAVLVGVLSFHFGSRKAFARRLVSKRIRNGEIPAEFFGYQSLDLGDDSYQLRFGTFQFLRYYAGIQTIRETASCILIYHTRENVDMIPASAFQNLEHRKEFLNLLQTRITQAKDVGIPPEAVEEKRSDADHVLEYTWTEDEFVSGMTRAGRLALSCRSSWKPSLIIVTLLGLFLLYCFLLSVVRLLFSPPSSDEFSMYFSIMPMFLALLFSFAFLSPVLMTLISPWAKSLYRKRIENGVISRSYFKPQALCFAEDRITEMQRTSSTDTMYNLLSCVKQDSNGMYLILKGLRVCVIPEAAFSSPAHKSEIATYLEEKIRVYSKKR